MGKILVLSDDLVPVTRRQCSPDVDVDLFRDEARRSVYQGHVAAAGMVTAERKLNNIGGLSTVGRVKAGSQTLGKIVAPSRIELGMVQIEAMTEVTFHRTATQVLGLAQ